MPRLRRCGQGSLQLRGCPAADQLDRPGTGHIRLRALPFGALAAALARRGESDAAWQRLETDLARGLRTI